jgi:glycosyltransferase involved in cell wall biosynthesis
MTKQRVIGSEREGHGMTRNTEDVILQEGKAKLGIDTTIIVPAYNEEKGLPVILERLRIAVDGRCEVLVVDDGSDDETSKAASGFSCRVIRHKENRGKGEALKTGIRHAKGTYVIFIDADDTYPAEAIPEMMDELQSCDVVYAPRAFGRQNIPRFNRLGNAIFQNLIRYIYGFKGSDYCTGLYGIRKRCLETMDISSSGFSVEPEIVIKACRMKLRVQEVPVEYRARIGQAKLSWLRDGFEHMRTILRLVFWRP